MNSEVSGHPHTGEIAQMHEMIRAGRQLATAVEGFVVHALASREGANMDHNFVEEGDGRSTGIANLRDATDPSNTFSLLCNWPGRGKPPVSAYVTKNTADATIEYHFDVSPGLRQTNEDRIAAWEVDGKDYRTIEASMKVTPKIGPNQWDTSRQEILPLSEAAVAELVEDIQRPEVQPVYNDFNK